MLPQSPIMLIYSGFIFYVLNDLDVAPAHHNVLQQAIEDDMKPSEKPLLIETAGIPG
jgi:hypothetical protein